MFLILLTIISFLVYLTYLLIFYSGLKNRKSFYSFKRPFVSVIVAARNEEKNLTALLTYLKNQTYPPEIYEVIIADDNSEDNSESIIKTFMKNWKNLKYLKIENRENVKSPKKNALTKAIEKSRGEVLLLTDADCFLPKKWIASMVSNFTDEVSMVCGFSRTKIDNWEKAPIYVKFELLDFFVMYAAAAGAISSGFYFSCSGQNIAYKKSDFYDVGGFDKVNHIQSGDDVNLLQLFRKAGKKAIFSFDYNSFVYTKPIKSFTAFINQRIRWASNYKYQSTLNPLFFIYLTFTFILTLFIYIIPFINIVIGLSIIFFKFVFDMFFVITAFKVFGIEQKRLSFFPIWFVLQPIYIVLVSILGLFEIFRWKR